MGYIIVRQNTVSNYRVLDTEDFILEDYTKSDLMRVGGTTYIAGLYNNLLSPVVINSDRLCANLSANLGLDERQGYYIQGYIRRGIRILSSGNSLFSFLLHSLDILPVSEAVLKSCFPYIKQEFESLILESKPRTL